MAHAFAIINPVTLGFYAGLDHRSRVKVPLWVPSCMDAQRFMTRTEAEAELIEGGRAGVLPRGLKVVKVPC